MRAEHPDEDAPDIIQRPRLGARILVAQRLLRHRRISEVHDGSRGNVFHARDRSADVLHADVLACDADEIRDGRRGRWAQREHGELCDGAGDVRQVGHPEPRGRRVEAREGVLGDVDADGAIRPEDPGGECAIEDGDHLKLAPGQGLGLLDYGALQRPLHHFEAGEVDDPDVPDG